MTRCDPVNLISPKTTRYKNNSSQPVLTHQTHNLDHDIKISEHKGKKKHYLSEQYYVRMLINKYTSPCTIELLNDAMSGLF